MEIDGNNEAVVAAASIFVGFCVARAELMQQQCADEERGLPAGVSQRKTAWLVLQIG
jgi:hypothetical protein